MPERVIEALHTVRDSLLRAIGAIEHDDDAAASEHLATAEATLREVVEELRQ